MVAEGVDVGWRSDSWYCFRAIYYRLIFQKINLISHFVKLFTLKAQQFFCTNLLHLSNFVVHLYRIIICMHNTEQFISSSTVKEQGRSKYYKMLDKAKQGDLIQICRGIYATSEQLSGNMIDIDAVVKGGILCLWSAWNIHKLTTSMPQAFHIAIQRGRKVTVPAFPQIEIHHYTEKILNVGVMKMTIDGFSVNVYDVEKCVCDAVKFRNKIGTDVCSEIISNYLERPERNISKLMYYAKLLRVHTTLEKYLEIKL